MPLEITWTPNGSRLEQSQQNETSCLTAAGRAHGSTTAIDVALMQNRRFAVPFDPEFFAHRAAAGDDVTPLAAFRHTYATNHWAGLESPSGAGASLDQTAAIRHRLPELCRRLKVRTLLDLPCGDCSWMATIDLGAVKYIGADFLPELIEEATRRHGGSGREFKVLDLLSSSLPAADLVLCRDCLVHLAFADIARAIANLRASRITYLLTTTFPEQSVNEDIHTGDWRPLNLEIAPFHWPRPQEILNEACTEAGGLFHDKSLGLWRVDVLPALAAYRAVSMKVFRGGGLSDLNRFGER